MKAPHPRKPLSLGPRRTVNHPTIHSPTSPFANHALSPYYVPAMEWDARDEWLKKKNWVHSLGRAGLKMIKGRCAQTTAKQVMLCGKAAPNSSLPRASSHPPSPSAGLPGTLSWLDSPGMRRQAHQNRKEWEVAFSSVVLAHFPHFVAIVAVFICCYQIFVQRCAVRVSHVSGSGNEDCQIKCKTPS